MNANKIHIFYRQVLTCLYLLWGRKRKNIQISNTISFQENF